MRALLVLGLLALAGCAAPEGGHLLRFHLANEALEGGATVVVTLSGEGADEVRRARSVPYDPVVPSDAFEAGWSEDSVRVGVRVEESGLAADHAFPLRGQETWWIYVAVYGDRVRVERHAEQPLFD